MNMFNLEGKTAIVTGASGILGPYFIKGLKNYGAKVVAVDISEKVLDLFPEDDETLSIICDISREEDVVRTIGAAIRKFNKIDILHNNAQGKTYSIPFEEYDLEKWHETMKVNVDGYFLFAKHVGRHMKQEAIKGSVIQTSSIYGAMAPDFRIYEGIKNSSGYPMTSPAVYSVSKAGIQGLTKYLASYWAPAGIRVNTLIPGGVKGGQQEAFIEKYSSRIPLGRMAEEDDMVGPLIFLASDASRYITGQEIFVDGGLHVW